jgi:putative redox protein
MKILLTSTDRELEYVGTNSSGNKIALSGKEGVSPMESVLIASAACSSIDIELILSKMRQTLLNLEVEVAAKRAENEIPKVFTEIHLHYKLYGDLKQKKAESAVEKSVEKYCSVLTMLESKVKVSHSYEIINLIKD